MHTVHGHVAGSHMGDILVSGQAAIVGSTGTVNVNVAAAVQDALDTLDGTGIDTVLVVILGDELNDLGGQLALLLEFGLLQAP